MANKENPEAGKASWTVKSMPVETRKLAVACATKTGEQMAAWLDRAVRTQASLEAGERVLPPVRTSQAVATLPAAYAHHEAPELGELAALMEQARALASAAELPIPKVAVRHALQLMTAQLRAARGLPPLAQRKTRPKNGQTVEHDGPPA